MIHVLLMCYNNVFAAAARLRARDAIGRDIEQLRARRDAMFTRATAHVMFMRKAMLAPSYARHIRHYGIKRSRRHEVCCVKSAAI